MSTFEEIKDKAIFETYTGRNILALDTGYFTVGEDVAEGAQPGPAEVFTVVHMSENKIALKTGYGLYVSVNSAGELTGQAEAIGLREMWDPVFEDVSNSSCNTVTIVGVR